jgi:hypothetical protein
LRRVEPVEWPSNLRPPPGCGFRRRRSSSS